MKLAILVVDDEEPILRAFERITRYRHEVIFERTGAGALDLLRSDVELDLTFLDMMLPDVTGAEVLRELRLVAPARLERLVVATGGIAIPGIGELLEAFVVPGTGARLPVLEKPYGIEAITTMINRFASIGAPRGPRYRPPPLRIPRPEATPRRRQPSSPDLADLVDDTSVEVSTVTELAEIAVKEASPSPVGAIALAVRDLRARRVEDSDRIGHLEEHFRDDGPGKMGIVRSTAADVHSIKSNVRFLVVGIPLLGLILAGLAWVITAVARPPTPPPPVDVKAIAREVKRQMQEPTP